MLIPTHRRPDKLAACLASLARQSFDPTRFEVLVGVDGPDTGEAAAAARALPRARVFEFNHAGPAATRNQLLACARGEFLLWLNDDVALDPGCLAVHAAAHADLAEVGRDAMILGSAPWAIREPDRLFDRLLRETSMIFFYDRMDADQPGSPDRDWGFRHAWTLNLSIRRSHADAEPFDDTLPCACFEDLEWAWRQSTRRALPVLYRPRAVAIHDHRYEPVGYLARERLLGREAFRLALAAPDCARAIFNRDLTSPAELRYALDFVERERPAVAALEESFQRLADLPADALAAAHAPHLTRMLYEHHLPLKRWHWRTGLIEAAAGAPYAGSAASG